MAGTAKAARFGRKWTIQRPLAVLACLASALTALPAAGQSVPPEPTVLQMPASVRSAGFAGSSTALIGDAGSVFTNPSGLATIKYLSIEAGYARVPGQDYFVTGAVASRIGRVNLGGGYQYLNFNDTSAVRDNLVWAGTAVYRFGMIGLGATGKYVSVEDSAGVVTRSGTADIGLTLAFFDIMALAVTVQNAAKLDITGPLLSLPTTTHVGFSFNFTDPQASLFRLMATVEGVWTQGQPHRTLWGLETGVVAKGFGVLARAGYGTQPVAYQASKWAFGAAVVLHRVRIDYAYQELVSGEPSHWIGARWTP